MSHGQAIGRDGLGLVLFSGGYDRVHYALAMAAAAAASGRRVSLLVTGRALPALLPGAGPDAAGWHGLDAADDGSSPRERDRSFEDRGVATFEELLTSCGALGITVIVCEMGLRALNLAADTRLRDDVPATLGGIVGFLGTVGGGSLLFI
jgi:peroxiredoxin family protein